jgi:hypothetical protein
MIRRNSLSIKETQVVSTSKVMQGLRLPFGNLVSVSIGPPYWLVDIKQPMLGST